jgi:aspartate/methionine/tyrosine aminotransferase
MKLADRMSRLGTETAFVVLAKAKEIEKKGIEVIHLEIGEPDFDTPKNIIDEAVNALNNHWTHYCPSAGLPEFRQTIAKYVSGFRGSVINFIGAKPVPIKMREEKQFRLDVDELISLITPKTRMIIINSPQNPTGSILTKGDLEAIAEVAIKNDIYVLSDEIYSCIIYKGRHFSIASLPGMLERTIILDGYSKTYAMTGWRLGYGIMPSDLAEQVAKLQTNCTSCTASFTQIAGIRALKDDQSAVERMVAEFKRRRDVIVEGLNKIEGIECQMPEGAFYVFPNIKKLGVESGQLENRLLNEAGVAVLSGTAFGDYGEGYLRLSYANSVDNILKALSKITNFVKKL